MKRLIQLCKKIFGKKQPTSQDVIKHRLIGKRNDTMPNNNNAIGTGKPGTITPEEFDNLTEMTSAYGSKVLASKLAKICTKKASMLKHEYPGSAVGAAFASTADRLSRAVGPTSRSISRDAYSALSVMVDRYGAEVVTSKLAKIAGKLNASADATLLKGIFPRS